MTKRRVFYSFHYDNDVWRVQQIRHIGEIEDNQPVSPTAWEEVKRRGDDSIKNWINNEIAKCSCLLVLVGSQTSNREWVDYEIERAWNQGKGIAGIYIHNLKDNYGKTCSQGKNPFEKFTLKNGTISFGNVVKCYNPSTLYAYDWICDNLPQIVEEAIAIRERWK